MGTLYGLDSSLCVGHLASVNNLTCIKLCGTLYMAFQAYFLLFTIAEHFWYPEGGLAY
jgi:hypothetical protein